MDSKYKKSNSHLTMRIGFVLKDALFYIYDMVRQLRNVQENYRMFAYIPFGSFSFNSFLQKKKSPYSGK